MQQMEIHTESFQPLFFQSQGSKHFSWWHNVLSRLVHQIEVWMSFLSLQEYEAITRGLVRGNPSVPVQGTADEIKQVPV